MYFPVNQKPKSKYHSLDPIHPISIPIINTIAVIAQKLFSKIPNKIQDSNELTNCLKTLIYSVTIEELKVHPARAAMEYYPIWESDTFTMCVFVLKKGATMPVHDHPSMTVFSKIIFGDLYVQTFEFLSEQSKSFNLSRDNVRLCKTGINSVISSTMPESLLFITPETGPSIHSFTAASDFVVILDLIGPPYNDDRPCTYYRKLNDISSDIYKTQYLVPSLPMTDESENSEANSPPNLKVNKKKKITKKFSFDILHSNSQNREKRYGNSKMALFDTLYQSPANEFLTLSETFDTNIDELCLLEIVPDMDYECDEQLYTGQDVKGSDLISVDSIPLKDIIRLANGVVKVIQ
ncbi:hypothetical protein HK096_008620, partial [Nowakowskiella sp. JEL0078]